MTTSLFSASSALAASFLFLSTSCATLVAGSSSEVSITSHPTGASVSLSNGSSGQTPFTATLANGTPVHFEATHAGYPGETRAYDSVPRLSGWVAGNILLGGLIGLVVDMANPSAKVHKGDVHFDFEALPEAEKDEQLKSLAGRDDAKAASERNKRATSGGTLR